MNRIHRSSPLPLHEPAKWTYYYLYVILDVFSPYVVGWMVAHRESATLAQRLYAFGRAKPYKQTTQKQRIQPTQLTIYADREAAMTSKAVALLLSDLGVTKTHSYPYLNVSITNGHNVPFQLDGNVLYTLHLISRSVRILAVPV